MGFSAYQIVGKEKRYFRMESHFVQDKRNQLMVKQWEKLGDIKCQLLWNALDTNIFSFYLFFLILYFFSFEFLFPFIDDEEAHDTKVT